MKATARELVDAAPLPDGWSFHLIELHRHKYRSLWRIEAVYGNVVRARWDTYRVGAALPACIAWVEAHPVEALVVTTDAEGHVVSIEDAP